MAIMAYQWQLMSANHHQYNRQWPMANNNENNVAIASMANNNNRNNIIM